MRNLQKISALLIITSFIFQSCTSVAYTHQQVLERYNTKDSILYKFGIPTTKKSLNGYEEWIYDYGNSTYSNTLTTYKAAPFGGVNAYGGTSVQTYSKFLKFTFRDGSDNATSWESQGINLEQVVKDKQATTWAWILGIAGIGGLIALLAAE